MAATGPYEFFTDGDVHVFLHDMDFLGVLLRADSTVRFYFRSDRDWTPAEARETPVVELTFLEVEVRRWVTDLGKVSRTEALGQVSGFDWDGRDGFRLDTWTLSLEFVASRMEARLIAAAPESLEAPRFG